MLTILRVMKELVKHLEVVSVLSRNYILRLLVICAHCLLPKHIFVVLGDIVQDFLQASQKVASKTYLFFLS